MINGVCGCLDDLVLDSTGTFCYDGIDSTFDQTQFTCETDETDALLDMLGYRFGLDYPERFGVDCDTFGYPVIQADYIGGVQGRLLIEIHRFPNYILTNFSVPELTFIKLTVACVPCPCGL